METIVLSALTMSMLTGTRSVNTAEKEKHEGKKKGFRIAVQTSESAIGIPMEGYALYETYDPNEIDKNGNLWLIFKGSKIAF